MPSDTTKKPEVFTVRLPRDIAQQVREHAKLEGETTSGTIRILVQEALATPKRSSRLFRGLTDEQRKAMPEFARLLLDEFRRRGIKDKKWEAGLEEIIQTYSRQTLAPEKRTR